MDMNNVEQVMDFLKSVNINLSNAANEIRNNSFETAVNIYVDCYAKAKTVMSQDEKVIDAKDNLMALAAYNAGVCYLKLKNPIEAIKYCKKAVKINPDNGNYNYNTALASFKIYETDDAILYANKAAQIMPNDIQTKKLVEVLDKCTKINPILKELAEL